MGLLTQRYDFSKHGSAKMNLEDYRDRTFVAPEANMGSPRTLQDFIAWARETHRGDFRQFLILSGHGSGTTEDFLMKDEASMDSLTIDELKEVLEVVNNSGRKLDVLGMDACYMAMGEIAYEIRGYVDILIAAEGLEPAFGWPYGRIMKEAKAAYERTGSHMSPEQLAKAVVQVYVDHYSDYDRSAGRSADLAAINLNEIERVKVAFGELVKALEGSGEESHDKLLLAHWYAQTYKADQFVDLKDLCAQIQAQFGEETKSGPVARR